GNFTTGATVNGQFNPQAGRTVTNPFGAENSGQQYDPAQRQAQNIDFEKNVAAQHGIKYMAMGGTVNMTQPHALINLISGRIAAIAGEAGPEQAKFNGRAFDPNKYVSDLPFGGEVMGP